MVEDQIYNIIVRKLSGESLSDQDQQMLESWLLTDGNYNIFTDLSKVWSSSGNINFQTNVNVDSQWEIFKKEVSPIKKNNVRRLFATVSSIAASILIIVGVFVILNNQTVVYKYSSNQNHFTLPDNSEVWLNKNTSIEFSKNFGKKARTIKLDGEAFFEVTKNKIPFVVNTNSTASVKVLGTSFNLKSYAADNTVQLQVISGVVEFGELNENKSAIVKKGNESVYTKDSNKLTTAKFTNSNKISWRTGEFSFDNSPVSEVVELLEDYLSVKIIMPNSAINLHYSGKFNKPSANDVAIILSKAFGFEYQLQNKKIVFTEKTTE